MAWKERRVYRQQQHDIKIQQEREQEKKEALKELNIEYIPEDKQDIPKKPTRLEQIHEANLKRKEERQKEYVLAEARKEQKQRQRDEWKRKFSKRTRKGQLPLDHRINYVFKKIKDQKRSLS
ncbi:hypothetical protein NEOKW01_1751 [Nematocida sp. AWRm80]|nr:hypothetical protein NEOKW01_1751 [Nematocida sp. AWRm80]